MNDRTKVVRELADGARPWTPPDREEPPADEAGGSPPTQSAPNPVIQWEAHKLPSMVAEAEAALMDSGLPVYQRGGQLIRLVQTTKAKTGAVRRAQGATVMVPLEAAWLVGKLTDLCRWERLDSRSGKWKRISCPPLVATTYLALRGDWRVPELRAVVDHPLITADGRIVASPGYDPSLEILVNISGNWPIPVDPTLEDAKAAVARLIHLLRYFPFATGQDRAVALSLLLSALERPDLPAVPMHAIDAPEAGTGKSLLVDAASILATGAPASVMDYGSDPDEAGKRLDGMLLAGDSIIAIDNVEAPLEGAGLCQALTQTTRRVRPLGTSQMVTVAMAAFVAATGNNLVLRGDITRRTLVCRLDAKTDRPERRTINQDLLREVADRRRELVADLLCIIAAYHRAGRPDVGLSPLGSFGDWSRTVRAALVWAGEADPVGTMERTRAADPAREALTAVLEAWRSAFGRDAKTAAEAIAHAERDAALRDALAIVAERRGNLSSSALGYWLRAHKDRRAGNLALRSAPGRAGVARWTIETTGGSGGDGGDGGHVYPTREKVSGVTNHGGGAEHSNHPHHPHHPNDDDTWEADL